MRPYIVGNLVRDNVELALLPGALLSDAKAQMRVKFNDDDTLISGMIQRAITWVEANAELSINPQTWSWEVPAQQYPYTRDDWCYCWWYGWEPLPLPRRPVQTFTIVDGDGNSVSGDYTAIKQQDTTGITETKLRRTTNASAAWPAKITMQCGYATKADLPVMVADAVLRYTAYLYENREAYQGVQFHEMPDFAPSILGPLWVPRV